MGLENNMPPKDGGDVALIPGAYSDLNNSPYRPTEETSPVHPKKMVALHWLTVFCLCLAATLILIRDEVDGRVLRQWLLEGHRHFGLFVLILFFARVAVRIRLGKARSDDNPSWLMRFLAGLTHVALYAALLAQPLLGWILSDAQGKPVYLLGATLPALVAADEDLADKLQIWHVDVAWLLLALISLHIAAALWHHFVLRDHVLRMMLPKRRHA
jgi:cytochrome b561